MVSGNSEGDVWRPQADWITGCAAESQRRAMNRVWAPTMAGRYHLLEAVGVFAEIVQKSAPGSQVLEVSVIGSGHLGQRPGQS